VRGRTPPGDLDRAADEAQPPLDRKIIGRQQPRRRHRAGGDRRRAERSGILQRVALEDRRGGGVERDTATQRRVVIRFGGGAKFEIGTVDLGRALRIAAAAVGGDSA
jgi:hypothetical protein